MVNPLVKHLFIKLCAGMGVPQFSFVTTHLTIDVHGDFPKLCKTLGIRSAPVAAYHPEANGIAEAKVKALKLLLRSLIKSEQKQWDKFLPFAIFAFNTSFNNQTGITPFFINHGFEANLPGQVPMSLIAQNIDFDPKTNTNSYCSDV